MGVLDAPPARPPSQERSDSLRPWRLALANRQYAPANLLLLGDSIIEWNTESPATVLYGDTVDNRRWPTILRKRLQLELMGAEQGWGYIPVRRAADTTGGRWVLSAGSEITAGLNSRNFRLTASGHACSITTPVSDRFQVSGASGSGVTGSFTVVVDGGAPTTVTPGTVGSYKANRMLFDSGALAATTHTVVLTWVSGLSDIDGIVCYNGDWGKGIRLWDAGHSAYAVSNILANAQWDTGFDNVAPHLTILSCSGINEKNLGQSTATFATNLQTLVTRIRTAYPTGSIGMLKYWGSIVMANEAEWQAYEAVVKAVCLANTKCFLIDAYTSAGYVAAISDPSGLANDGTHPTDKGAQYLADLVYAHIMPRPTV